MVFKTSALRASQFAVICAVTSCTCFAFAQTATPIVPLQASPPIAVAGGAGHFDLLEVDAANHRLLVPHGGNKSLDVFDLSTGLLIKQIPTGGANGVAIDARDGKYYVGAGDANAVVVIDSQTLAVVKTIPLDGPVDAMAFDSKRGIVYAGHDDGTQLWTIDAATDKLVGTIDVPEAPEIIEYDPQTDRIYQNIKSQPLMLVINPETRTIEKRVDITPVSGPHGLAIDFASGHLFTIGGGKLVEIDLKTNAIIAQIDVAKGVDQIALDSTQQRIYCASGSGTLSVVRETATGMEILGEVATARGCHSVTVDPTTGDVWVAYGDKTGGSIMRLTPRTEVGGAFGGGRGGM